MKKPLMTSFLLASVLAVGCAKAPQHSASTDGAGDNTKPAPAESAKPPADTVEPAPADATVAAADTFVAPDSAAPEGDSATPDSAAPADTTVAPDSAAPGGDSAAPDALGDNHLSLANGAFLVAQPEYQRAFDNSPINLIFEGMMWRSDEGKVTDQVFVIEVPGVTTLKTIGFDTHHIFHTEDENARQVLLEASNTSATDGFAPILEVTLDKEGKVSTYPVATALPARWFRLTVKNNHGSTSAVALKRLLGYGTQEATPVPTSLTGTYSQFDVTTGEADGRPGTDLFLRQDGSSVVGCWRDVGSLTGGFKGAVAPIEWQHPDLGKNGGLLVATGPDSAVLWQLNSGGFWALNRYKRTSTELGTCGDGRNLGAVAETGLEKELAASGRAVVYGINFDFASDKLRAESKVVLDRIVAVLVAHPDWKMRIEGHTDSIGGARYNQTLSEKRAASVVGYLVGATIAADRLTSSGAGLSSPIDSNETELGRARNRRVELVKQ